MISDTWLGRFANLATIAAAIATAVGFAYAWWAVRCDLRYCLRKGDHEVPDTTAKVCDVHHTERWHRYIQEKESARDPRRLGWGE